MRFLLVNILVIASGVSSAQVIHPKAHAHNDYEHPRPLFDALQHGFRSVEADIHLIDGELYVAHNRPESSARRTLQALYLDPLDSLRKLEAGGHPEKSIWLMVDIKTDATRTLKRLLEILMQYPQLIPPDSPGYVRVIISGNRDYELILNSPGVSIDGRPGDLGKEYSPDKMPLISDHFGNWMHWNGKGKAPAAELERVRKLATRVHGEGKKLRLWAIPDREEAWNALLGAGVDLINSDRLEALDEFLTWREKSKQ